MEEFRDQAELAKAVPDPNAAGIVSWGRYAELFSYDEQSETLSLENPHRGARSRSPSSRPGGDDNGAAYPAGWNESARAIAQVSR